MFIQAPKLQCSKFSGGKKKVSKFEFKNFVIQFSKCTCSIKSTRTKLSLLKGYLTGYASQIISHQTLEDENLDEALELLKEEFLDISFIIDEIYKQIINTSPKLDTNHNNVKQYLAQIKADLSELNTSNDIIFFEESESGILLISHIIFSKLLGIL